MLRVFIFFIFILSYGNSFENLSPVYTLKANGEVQDIFYKNGLLYAGNTNRSVDIFDTETKELIETISVPKTFDFLGNEVSAKIFSIDVLDDKVLIVSQGKDGYRNLWIYENKELKNIIDVNKKYLIQKASFIDGNRVLFALLSNQIGVYNLQERKNEYIIQINHSPFSHYKLSEDKKSFASTDESGIVRIFNTKNLQEIRIVGELNLDKVFQLDYKKGSILTAGQDRKAIFYPNSGKASKLDFRFLLYSCALSPSSKYGAVAYNEDNEILVFNTFTKERVYNLTGQKSIITQMLFIGENGLFASSNSSSITFWQFN